MKKNKLATTIILGLILTTLPYGQAAAAEVIGREITTNDVTVTDPVSVTNTSTTGEDTYGIKVTGQLGSAITGIKLAGTTITATTAHDQVYALHAKHSVTTVAAGSTLTAKNEWTGDTNVGGSGAMGVYNNQADLTLGAKVTVNSTSSTTSKYGGSAIGISHGEGKLDIGDNLTVTAQASGQQVTPTWVEVSSKALLTRQDAITTLGANATLTAIASGTGNIVRAYAISSGEMSSQSVLTLGAHTTLRAEATGTIGSFIQAYGLQNGDGTNPDSNNTVTVGDQSTISAQVTVTGGGKGRAYGINNNTKNILNLGNKTKVSSIGGGTAAYINTYGVRNATGSTTVAGEALKLTWGDQLEFGAQTNCSGTARAYGLLNDAGSDLTIGKDARLVGLATSTENYAFAYGLANGEDAASTLTVGDNAYIGAQTNSQYKGYSSGAYGICNQNGSTLTVGNNAKIEAFVVNGGEAYGILNTGGSTLQLGANASIVAQSELKAKADNVLTYGIANNGGSTLTMGNNATIVAATKPSGQTIALYNDSDTGKSQVTLEGSFKLLSTQYAIYNAGVQQGLINGLAAGKDKVIEGRIITKDGAHTNILMDTAASYIDGLSWVYGASEFNLELANGATWFTKDDSDVTKLTLNNGGIVDQTAIGSGYQTLTVDTLSGNGGVIKLNTDLATGQADKVNIANSTAGTQYLSIIDNSQNTGVEAQGELLLVEDKGNNIKFVPLETYNEGLWLRTPDVVVKTEGGNTKVYLEKIDKRVTNSVTSLLNITDSVYGAWVKNDTMRQRLGELHQGDTEQGLWTRIYGGKLAGDGADSTYTTYQIGYDLSDHKTSKDWKLGAAFEYSKGSSDYLAGSGDNSVGAVTLYGTRQTGQGENIDLTLKHGEIKGDIKTYGIGQDSADYKTRGTAFSVEYNKRMNKANGSFVEPQAQLTVGSINSHDFTTAAGTKVANDSMSSAVARLGFLVGKETKQGDYYLRASVLHEFAGKGQVQMRSANNEFFSQDVDYSDTWFEVGLGTNVQLSKANNLYFDVERSFGAKINKQWQVNAGMRWEF